VQDFLASTVIETLYCVPIYALTVRTLPFITVRHSSEASEKTPIQGAASSLRETHASRSRTSRCFINTLAGRFQVYLIVFGCCINGRIFGIPNLDCQVGRLDESSTTEICNGNGMRANSIVSLRAPHCSL
jgi:hypothetical protein